MTFLRIPQGVNLSRRRFHLHATVKEQLNSVKNDMLPPAKVSEFCCRIRPVDLQILKKSGSASSLRRGTKHEKKHVDFWRGPLGHLGMC